MLRSVRRPRPDRAGGRGMCFYALVALAVLAAAPLVSRCLDQPAVTARAARCRHHADLRASGRGSDHEVAGLACSARTSCTHSELASRSRRAMRRRSAPAHNGPTACMP
eukprot:363107-Chlamydomonas_euryale.AAC.7